MRTFHTGGAATGGDDITQGLPRVQELFEARTPKGMAPISEVAGRVTIEEADRGRDRRDPGRRSEELEYASASARACSSRTARRSRSATSSCRRGRPEAGAAHPRPAAVQKHLVDEVQEVYRRQGVGIHDKHIEVIVRQMLRRVTIIDAGQADLLPGEPPSAPGSRPRTVGSWRRVARAAGRPELMGITKASLATDSWLSAASFQETTRVLTEAALRGRSDSLLGLKENVIIGKLIPAGTGLARYRDVKVEPTEEAKAAMYAMPGYDDLDYRSFGVGSGQAVPLEEYDGGYR